MKDIEDLVSGIDSALQKSPNAAGAKPFTGGNHLNGRISRFVPDR